MKKDNTKSPLGQGTWISLGFPVVTELISTFQFDWLLLDMEHGYLTEHVLLANMQAIRNKEIKQIIRIPTNNPALVARVLDWGASGIMLPHVSNSTQAKACIDSMRYPPYGNRGYSGQARSFNFGQNTPSVPGSIAPPYLIVQIEDYDGVLNADKIARTEGVDVLFVGPSDLNLDLSTRRGETFDFNDALKIVADAAIKNGKQAGILVRKAEDIPNYTRMGFNCLSTGSDLGMVRSGYQLLIKQLDQQKSK